MKKALMIVILVWLVLFSSSSFACSLCTELEKRGFSPDRVGKGIAEHFGGNLKIGGPGKPFSSRNGAIFNLAADQNGKIFRANGGENLRGVSFTGTINNFPVEIFISSARAEEIGFVGIKADANLLSPQRQPVRDRNLALRSFDQGSTTSRQATITPAILRQTVAETNSTEIKAEQIIEASMSDAPTLLLPADKALEEQKEIAAKTDQLAKRAEYKKRERSQRFLDAGVTSSAIVTGLAVPVYGPFIAGGIILSRVVYGLFQSDPDEENQ